VNVNASTHPGAVTRRVWLASSAVASILSVLVLLLLVAAVILSILTHQFGWSDLPQMVLLFIPFAGVGAVVARRQPRNPIGWILLAIVLALLASGVLGQYAVLHYRLGYRGLPLARVAVFLAAGWVWLIVLLPLAVAFFPDGRLPSPRWRWVLRAYLVLCAVFLARIGWQDFNGVAARHIEVDSSGELAVFGDSSDSSPGVLLNLLLALYAALCVAWLIGQVVRYRRATGDYRQQLKWLLSGSAICLVSLLLALSLGGSQSAFLRAVGGAAFLGVVALPIAIGVAILRYRLYEIDRLVSRTLSYAILTGLLVGIYLAVVTLTTRALPLSSPVGVAASTLAAAALFNPLRRRVQRVVDRRFNRARYDAEATVAAFTARLQGAVDLDTVRDELLQVAGRAVEPSRASLWVRPPNSSPRA
jgi:hypothetical protein